MNADNSNNGNSSATQPQNEHSRYERLTEAEFLAHQAELAKTALQNTLTEFKTNLAHAGDPKLWTHHYPWVSIGLAAATGFTLAAVVNGADTAPQEGDEPARRHMLHEVAKAGPRGVDDSKHHFRESLLGSLFSVARTALEASLVSAIHAQGREQSQSPPPRQTTSPVEGARAVNDGR